MTSKVNLKTAARCLRRLGKLRPKLAIVLGSGFQSVSDAVVVEGTLPYSRIPGFPVSNVLGHRGEVIIGRIENTPVLILSGRAHYYEGHSLAEVTFPIRVLAEYGIESVLLTNAAGGIHRRFRPGDFMLFSDHISLLPDNPLRGTMQNGVSHFLDLTDAYDTGLAQQISLAAKHARARLHRGVYLAVPGPNYETPAEIRAFAKLGADAVGMSTVPEVLVARQCGLRVAGLSCITNLAAGLAPGKLSHEEVIATAARTGEQARRMISFFAAHYV